MSVVTRQNLVRCNACATETIRDQICVFRIRESGSWHRKKITTRSNSHNLWNAICFVSSSILNILAHREEDSVEANWINRINLNSTFT